MQCERCQAPGAAIYTDLYMAQFKLCKLCAVRAAFAPRGYDDTPSFEEWSETYIGTLGVNQLIDED